MKIVSRIKIDRPLKEVMALMADPAHTSKWMHDLESYAPPGGGRAAQLTFKRGRANTVFALCPEPPSQPNELCTKLEGKNVVINTRAQFHTVSAKTELHFTQDFRFKGLGRIMAFVIRPVVRKQQKKHIQDFKEFAESHV